MKNNFAFLAGAAGAFLLPVYPYAAFCTVLVVVECVSAAACRRRQLRRGMAAERELASCVLWRPVTDAVRIYVALLVSHGADVVFGLQCCLRFTGAMICFRQVLAILENEAAAGGSSWAAALRKFLVERAEGYMNRK